MISLPILERIRIEGYQLYPGHTDGAGLEAEFFPGANLILGANGLGKSTLVHLIYRMCAGPTDIAGAPAAGDLGLGQLNTMETSSRDRATFASRVSDYASEATAEIIFLLGGQRFGITRKLTNLALLKFEILDAEQPLSEEQLQRSLCEAAGLDSFVDWLLALRYLVFFSDERRSLVWDRTAQRQLLRVLFLSPAESKAWIDLERDFLRKASAYRNYRAILSTEQTTLRREEARLEKAPALTKEIALLSEELEAVNAERADLSQELFNADEELNGIRLQQLQSLEMLSDATADLKRLRHARIANAFPTAGETAAFLITELVTGEECRTCGSVVPNFAEKLRSRLNRQRCVMCETPLHHAQPIYSLDDYQAAEESQLAATERARALTSAHESMTHRRHSLASQLQSVQYKHSELRAKMDALNARLPADNDRYNEHLARFQAMQSRLRELQIEADESQQRYQNFVATQQDEIGARREDIKLAFNRYVSLFMVDTVELTWQEYFAAIGQLNSPTTFYTFSVSVGSAALGIGTSRERAQDVSESQREFIDLAFRMALVVVASKDAAATLVIDTPEASLDAVFAARAAEVLNEFAFESSHRRIIVTSNLVDGGLVPAILRKAGIKDQNDRRITNLIDVARPTTAIETLRTQYETAVQALFNLAAERK